MGNGYGVISVERTITKSLLRECLMDSESQQQALSNLINILCSLLGYKTYNIRIRPISDSEDQFMLEKWKV